MYRHPTFYTTSRRIKTHVKLVYDFTILDNRETINYNTTVWRSLKMKNENLYQYILGIADNNLILGQRLGELCGHGPEFRN